MAALDSKLNRKFSVWQHVQCRSRSVPEIQQHNAGTLKPQQRSRGDTHSNIYDVVSYSPPPFLWDGDGLPIVKGSQNDNSMVVALYNGRYEDNFYDSN